MKRFLLLLLPFAFVIEVTAQTTCSDKLRQGQRYFDDGQLDLIPQMLESCMKEGFTNEEKITAYKLLIQTYLFNEEPEKADAVMIQFLREFPSYVIAANDPKEFINLHRTYRTEPIFKLDFFVGGNYSLPKVKEYFSVANLNDLKIKLNSKFGFTAGIIYTDRLYKDIEFSAGLNYSNYRLDYTDNQYAFTTLTGKFRNAYLGIPLSVKYNVKYRNIRAFGRVGFETVYLLYSKMDFTKGFTDPTKTPLKSTEDLSAFYGKVDIRPYIAVGFPFTIGKYELVPSVGFKISTIPPLTKKQAYSNDQLREKYLFIPSILYHNQFYFSLSFMKPVYNPKKIQ